MILCYGWLKLFALHIISRTSIHFHSFYMDNMDAVSFLSHLILYWSSSSLAFAFRLVIVCIFSHPWSRRMCKHCLFVWSMLSALCSALIAIIIKSRDKWIGLHFLLVWHIFHISLFFLFVSSQLAVCGVSIAPSLIMVILLLIMNSFNDIFYSSKKSL